MNEIGKFVYEQRTAMGLSFKEFGRKCKVSDTEIMKIEKGTREKPGWTNICNIAKVLGISPLIFLQKAGYISEDDIGFANRLVGISKLNDENLSAVQKFIDFLVAEQDRQGSV